MRLINSLRPLRRCLMGNAGGLVAIRGMVVCLLMLPGTAAAAGDYAQLELLAEADLTALLEASDPADSAALLITQAALLSERDPAGAMAMADAAQAVLKPSDSVGFAYLNAVRCWTLQHLSQMEQARRACQEAVSAGRAANDARALSRALGRQSILYFNSGDLALSAEVAQEALRHAEQAGDPGQLAVTLSALGRVARAQGLYDQSLAYYSRGLQSIDPITDLSRYRVLAFNVGLSHADLGQFEIAKDYYQETLAWTRDVGSLRKELTALIYIAKADIGLGNFRSAIQSLEAAVARPDFRFDPGHLAFAYSTLGDAYLGDGAAQSALAKYRRGLELAENNDNRFELRELRLGLGRALLASGDALAAQQVVEDLIADLRAEGAGEMLINSLFALSDVSVAQDDPARALDAYREAQQLVDDRNRIVADQRLARARAEFEFDEAELALARAQRDALLRNGLFGLIIAGLLIGYLVYSRRVQVQLAQAQRLESSKLEKVVAERTADLQKELLRRTEADEQRLQLQQRLAEDDKLRVLGQLTGGVAHDFNNLLTVVMGSAELLQAKNADLSDGDKQLLEHIVTAAGSGAGITRALMSYARQQPLRLEETDLHEFLNIRLPLVERALGGALSISAEFTSDREIRVLLDQDQLTTALLNLTLNARDAQNSAGEIRIVLGVENVRQAYLAVIDRGVGMSREQIRRACEPFYSTKRNGRGNGLGLSMVYGFAKQLGGDLQISSDIGHGTEVRMLLPMQNAAADLRVV